MKTKKKTINLSQKIRIIHQQNNKLGFYDSIDVMRKHKGYFFSKGNMRFFDSRILGNVYSGTTGIYFVTSEKFNDSTPRLYTVRKFKLENARVIETVGEFNELTRARAISTAINLAYGEIVNFDENLLEEEV